MSKQVGNFTFIETSIKDVYIIEPKKYGDNRGYFMETYKKKTLKKLDLIITLFKIINLNLKREY